MISIREGQYSDIPELITLNSSWQPDMIKDKRKGVLGCRFTHDEFIQLIDLDQVAVALADGQVVGYYLLNTVAIKEAHAMHAPKIAELKAKAIIRPDANIGLAAQVCINTAYNGQGIRKKLLQKLLDQLTGRYDYFFGSIVKENLKGYTAHTNDGWKVIDEDDSVWYVVFAVGE